MSETETSGLAGSSDGNTAETASVPGKFSFGKIAQFLNDLRSDEPVGVQTLEEADETLDDELCAKATKLLEEKVVEADYIAGDSNSVAILLDSLKNWSERFAAKLRPGAFESLTTVFRMLSSSISGEYAGFSKSSLACLVGAALYCVSPIDAIPDALPAVGLVDDAFVLGWTLKKIAQELQTFRMWERLAAAKSILASYLPYFNDVKRVMLVPGWMTDEQDLSEIVDVLHPVFPNAEFERFRWISNASWSAAREYCDERGPAELEAALRDSGNPENVALVGHSLGARITVRALARLAKEPQKKSFWTRKSSDRAAQAFLFGAAIDAEDPDLTLAASGVNAPLCNFYNRSDRVLSYLYRASEQKTPLGLSGLAFPLENYVDCVVSGREEYWIDVADNVSSILSFFRSKSLLSKLSVAEVVDGGLPEYWKHEFKLYAQFFKNSVSSKSEDDGSDETAK